MKSRIILNLILLTAGFSVAGAVTMERDSVNTLEEIVITGNSARQRIENLQIGTEHLELSKLNRVPALGGERDIIKSITLLPGVRSEGDGGGGFEVRGGSASQNLVLLDGITLYNPSHVMGIFSTFNDKAIGSATLSKGPFRPMYGGATSGVLETSLATGDNDRWHGAGSIGILAAKISAGGPIVKDRLTMAVTARRSYVDAFLQLIPKYRSTVMNFYDITAKLRFTPDHNNIIDGSFFAGRDNMAISNVMGMYWGNIGASVNWFARYREQLSFVTNIALDHYNPKMEMLMLDMNQVMKTYIRTYAVNEQARIELTENHTLRPGFRSELFRVRSGEWMFGDNREREERSLWENSIWIDYEGHLTDRFELVGGVRLDLSSVLSSGKFNAFEAVNMAPPEIRGKTYTDLQPRVSLKYNLSGLHSLRAGFGTSVQNLHAVRTTTTSFPFDRYALTSYEIKPERAEQYGIGYSGMTVDGGFDWSVEGYYKSLNNIYDYRDGVNSFSSIDLQSLILGGRGRSYGLEFMFRKNTGRLTGWVAYTISRTQTKIDGINNGKWYNASNDRRNDISIAASYQLNKGWNFSASWIFLSGQPLTAPDLKYELSGITVYYYSKRNSYKTPPVHRLDLSATYTHIGKKLTYEWNFGIYNTYCRINPFVVYFEDDPSKPSGTRAVSQAMYGLIPSVTYTLQF